MIFFAVFLHTIRPLLMLLFGSRVDLTVRTVSYIHEVFGSNNTVAVNKATFIVPCSALHHLHISILTGFFPVSIVESQLRMFNPQLPSFAYILI